jgi:2-hydroxychromene-2-carboxylate isomerase
MGMRIVHYFSPMSGYAYLGFRALCAMAERHQVTVLHRPMDIQRVFAAIDAIAPARQSPARLAWRRTDMMRFAQRRALPLNAAPRHWPVDATLASCAIIAAQESGADVTSFVDAALSAVWARDLDIAQADTIVALATACGLDGAAVVSQAKDDRIRRIYQATTDDAIAAGVVGSPTIFVGSSMFFGQDRLDFVEEALTHLINA